MSTSESTPPAKAWRVARDHSYRIGTLLEITEAVSEQLGTPCAGRTPSQVSAFGDQFEYLIDRLREQNAALGAALDDCEPEEVLHGEA